MECQYALGSFGIPLQSLPLDTNGALLPGWIESYCKERQILEAHYYDAFASNATDYIEFPNKFDILLGRGRPYQEWPGNLRLSTIVDIHRTRYQNIGRGKKPTVCKEIVEIIKESSKGRFLKRADNNIGWIEVSDEVARDKVGHGFRTKTRRNSAPDPDEEFSGTSRPVNFWAGAQNGDWGFQQHYDIHSTEASKRLKR
jgi:hypothetical protein